MRAAGTVIHQGSIPIQQAPRSASRHIYRRPARGHIAFSLVAAR